MPNMIGKGVVLLHPFIKVRKYVNACKFGYLLGHPSEIISWEDADAPGEESSSEEEEDDDVDNISL